MSSSGGSQETVTDVNAVVPRDPTADLARGDALGRYVVLDVLGAGAMGRVYTAFDPELDRKVAVKLLHGSHRGPGTAGTTRMLREAQALAKLSHPNVVTVHDVGRTDLGGGRHKSVWIAMELVEGTTLTKWLAVRARNWTEVVDVLTGAAAGLAAAHARGLVHRDIKPDNVMIGEDGRVRVMDFGLARGATSSDAADSEDPASDPIPKDSTDALASQRHLDVVVTRPGATPGTPAYMSPEQISGVPPDARSDQFSFCVMLWEALYGQRPFDGATLPELADRIARAAPAPPTSDRGVPRWLHEVVLRGLCVDPAKRWASLPELLEGIEQGRTKTRRRRTGLVVGGIAVLIGSLLGVEQLQDNARFTACKSQARAVDEVWNDTERARVAESLRASGAGNAETTVTKVMPWLDQRAVQWKAARAEACIDEDERGPWDARRTAASKWCLEERRLQFAALVEQLQTADVETVNRAVRAAASPSGVRLCRRIEAIERLPTPPTDQRDAIEALRVTLSHASALEAVGHYADALSTARAGLERAEAVGWTPLVHEFRRREGQLLHLTGDAATAEPLIEAAYFGAMSDGLHDTALSATFALIKVANRRAQFANAERWAKHARLLVAEQDEPQPLREMMLLNRIATTRENSGDYDGALAHYRKALRIVEATLGEDHPAAGDAASNLAQALHTAGMTDEAIALHVRARAISENALGPDHPRVANILNNLATAQLAAGDAKQAAALLERAVAILEGALGPEHPRVATSLANLANARRTLGERRAALELHERALKIREAALGPGHPQVAESLNNLGIVRRSMGDVEGATALYRRAIDVWLGIRPDHPNAAAAMTNLGNLLNRDGAHEEAKKLHRQAIDIWTKSLGPEHPHVASATNNLADAHRSAGELTRARPLYEQALALRQEALGPDHPLLSSPLIGLARVALREQRGREATEYAERAVAVLEGKEGRLGRLALARFVLARAITSADGDRARAQQLADLALSYAREHASDPDVDRLAIERWMADHGLTP